MSKTTKYLLGTLAIVGGSLYVYDQRSKTAVLDHEKFRQQGHKAVDKVSDKAGEILAISRNKADLISKDLTDLKNKASSKVNAASEYVQDKLQDVKAEASKAKDQTEGFLGNLFSKDKEPVKVEEKDLIRQAGAKYIDAVNELGELASKTLGVNSSKTVRQVNNDAEKKANSWFNWGSSKSEEAKNKAVSEFEDAKKLLEKAKKDAQALGESWINWGKDKKDELAKKNKEQLDIAQKKFNDALANLKLFGNELYQQYTKEIPYAADKKLAERSANNLRGWGENAAALAQEELDTLNDYKNKPLTEVNWADDAFNKLQELAQYAQEQSQKKYDEIKAELEKQKKAAGGWFSKKSEEAEKQTAELQKQLDEAGVQFEKSRKNAQDWASKKLSEATSAAAGATASTIEATKNTLQSSHEAVQSGLTLAKEWANEKK